MKKQTSKFLAMLLACIMICSLTLPLAGLAYQIYDPPGSTTLPATIQNGGFETRDTTTPSPVIKNTKGAYTVSHAVYPGWTSEVSQQMEIWYTGFKPATGTAVNAKEGNFFAELNVSSPDAIYQDLSTEVGVIYQWSLWHRARATTNTMQLSLGDPAGSLTPAAKWTDTGAGGTVLSAVTQWTEHFGYYTADSSATRFHLKTLTPDSGMGNFIDGIRWLPVASPVTRTIQQGDALPDEAAMAIIADGTGLTAAYDASLDPDINDEVGSHSVTIVISKDGIPIGTVTSTITVVAAGQQTYTLSYDLNGGLTGPADEPGLTAQTGHSLNTAVPTHDEDAGTPVVFLGWTETQHSGIFAYGDTPPSTITAVDIVDQDVTVYAAWGYDTNDNRIADVLEEGYTLTYDVGDGAGGPSPETDLLPQTGYALDTAIPTHDDDQGDPVIFIGWTLDPDAADTIYDVGDLPPETIAAVDITDQDVTVYAVWGYDSDSNNIADVFESTYTLTYDVGDGIDGPDDVSDLLPQTGYELDIDNVPTHTGDAGTPVIFIGWTLDPDAADTIYDVGDTPPATIGMVDIKGDTTVYAVWGYNSNGNDTADVFESTYTLTYDSNSGSTVAGQSNILDGSTVTAPPTPTRPGYTFGGWYQDSGLTTPWDFANDTITGDTTLYAKWVPAGGGGGDGGGGTPKHVVEFETNGGTELKSVSGEKNSVVSLDQTPAKEGHVFLGWYSDPELTIPISEVTLTSSVTVYAKWMVATEPETDEPAQLCTDDHFAYIIGYPDGTVRPTANISRAEVATIFFRLLTEQSRNHFWRSTNGFSDVNANLWYNNAVSTIASAGVITGYPDGTFGGARPITRAEFAAMMARFNDSVYTGADQFSDISDNWAVEYINRAAETGWILGYPDGTFRPDQYISRAEVVTLVNRMLGRDKITEDGMLPDMIAWPDNAVGQWYYEAMQEATNSHDYARETDGYEQWTTLLPVRDWAALETAWAIANSGK